MILPQGDLFVTEIGIKEFESNLDVGLGQFGLDSYYPLSSILYPLFDEWA